MASAAGPDPTTAILVANRPCPSHPRRIYVTPARTTDNITLTDTIISPPSPSMAANGAPSSAKLALAAVVASSAASAVRRHWPWPVVRRRQRYAPDMRNDSKATIELNKMTSHTAWPGFHAAPHRLTAVAVTTVISKRSRLSSKALRTVVVTGTDQHGTGVTRNRLERPTAVTEFTAVPGGGTHWADRVALQRSDGPPCVPWHDAARCRTVGLSDAPFHTRRLAGPLAPVAPALRANCAAPRKSLRHRRVGQPNRPRPPSLASPPHRSTKRACTGLARWQ